MPFDYSQPPQAADVQAMLECAELWPEDAAQAALALDQAEGYAEDSYREFETRTGQTPFLAAEEDSTQSYTFVDEAQILTSLAGGVLVLDSGLLSLTSCTLNGEPLDLGTGVLLRPSTAPQRRRPYTNLYLPFLRHRRITSYRRLTIAVTGRWGFCTQMPADAFNAILRFAAVQMLSVINTEQDTISLSQDAFSKGWDMVGTITTKDLLQEWPRRFDRTVERYKRGVV
jgi:hypothetical protein